MEWSAATLARWATKPLQPATYEAASREAEFEQLHWIDVSLEPSQPRQSFCDDFMAQSPFTALAATKP